MREEEKTGADRREFLRTGAATGALALLAARARPDAISPFPLEEADIASLQEQMRASALTARGLTQAYLDRIQALDRQGPTLRSILETNPDALDIAQGLDQERREKGPRGPLHGIPVLVKDNLDTADRMTTTAGSLALTGSIPARDSFVVRRLREAGAVILGKANLSEWANIRSNKSTSGWSGRGGQCRNPYVLDRNPCGSSSGSGAAVSANLCALAIGTETDGSIVCPSNANGVVGIKPTLGLVSRAGIIPIAHSQDTAGPMCRTVRDAAILLGAIAGFDANDPLTAEGRDRAKADYTGVLDRGGPAGRSNRGLPEGVRLPPRRGPDHGRGAPGAAARRRGARRSRRHSPRGGIRRERAPRAALRAQGRPQRLSGLARPQGSGQEPGRRDRLQRRASGPGDALLRPGALPEGAGEGAADREGVRR